jgi:hypothetical protein
MMLSKKKNKIKRFEAKANEKIHTVDQYWKIYFCELKKGFFEKKYISVIKSRSYEYAQEILLKKLNSNSEGLSYKHLKGVIIHKDSTFKAKNNSERIINIIDWQRIHECSFPNENDFLYKLLISKKEMNKCNGD